MMKFRDNRKEHNLKKYGIVPITFYVYAQMPSLILKNLHPFLSEAEAMEVGIEPSRDIVAFLFHECLLFFCETKVFKICHLLFHEFSKALWVNGVVSVYKAVAHHGTWEAVDNGATHRQFIEVGISKMRNNRFHRYCLFE